MFGGTEEAQRDDLIIWKSEVNFQEQHDHQNSLRNETIEGRNKEILDQKQNPPSSRANGYANAGQGLGF